VLIIEEPLGPLDDASKALIDDTMSRIVGEKTVILLPHRISTLRHCDQVFVVHQGALHAAGEHRELLANDDLYRHIYYQEFNPYGEPQNV
jgi:ABC-type bacteriocin/lantibiotic exporter with double-glycine peptidase domain